MAFYLLLNTLLLDQISLEIEEENQDGDGSLGTFNVIEEENKNLIFDETARA